MSNRIPPSEVRMPLGGQLLVATPRCEDNMFAGSVCLILHHSAEGSMGLVLNRAIEADVDGLWKFLEASQERAGKPIRFGGPVSGPILALHNQVQCAEVAAASGVYIAAHLDKLQQLVKSDSSEVRIVVGQVLWKSSQLEHEIEQGMWYPVPATPKLVFAPEDEMWRRSMLQVGNLFLSAVTRAKTPVDVRAN